MSTEEKQPVKICVHYEGKELKITTDSLQPLRSIKETIKATWDVPFNRQLLRSDGLELADGNSTNLWNVALGNISTTQKPSIFRTLEKLKDWNITLQKATEPMFEPLEPEDIPNIKRIPWEKKKAAAALNENRKVIHTLSTKERISEDHKDTATFVLSAKNGKWNETFRILETKPYIMNAIPQERAWSALHHAVFQNNQDAVKKLLLFATCDTEIKAKRDLNNHGWAGMTPLQLAKKEGCPCQELLVHHSQKDSRNTELTLVPTDQGSAFLENGIPYYDLASSFLRHDIVNSLKLEKSTFLYLTKEMYKLLEKDWKYVQCAIRECLYPFDKMVADRVAEASSADDLKKKLIWIYTCNRVYKQVNAALRRASETEFPVSDDLLLSLYSLFLTAVLLHWTKLERIQATTFRGLRLPPDQAKVYQSGSYFHWLPFTSSTRVESQARGFSVQGRGMKALFVINNSDVSLWSPRDIVPYSVNGPDFLEVVHPSCAKFCVTDVKKLPYYTEYHIKLLSNAE